MAVRFVLRSLAALGDDAGQLTNWVRTELSLSDDDLDVLRQELVDVRTATRTYQQQAEAAAASGNRSQMSDARIVHEASVVTSYQRLLAHLSADGRAALHAYVQREKRNMRQFVPPQSSTAPSGQ